MMVMRTAMMTPTLASASRSYSVRMSDSPLQDVGCELADSVVVAAECVDEDLVDCYAGFCLKEPGEQVGEFLAWLGVWLDGSCGHFCFQQSWAVEKIDSHGAQIV